MWKLSINIASYAAVFSVAPQLSPHKRRGATLKTAASFFNVTEKKSFVVYLLGNPIIADD